MAPQSRAGHRVVLRRSQFLVALLLLMLTLTAVLAYQAQDAARSYRATAERTLKDYADIAVWALNHNTQNMLFSGFRPALDSLRTGAAFLGGSVPATARGIRAPEACGCFHGSSPNTRFVVLADGSLLSERPLPGALPTFVLDSLTLRNDVARFYRGWGMAVAFPAGSPWAITFAKRPTTDGPEPLIVGFLSRPSEYGRLFAGVVRLAPMLPSSLLHGTSTGSVL